MLDTRLVDRVGGRADYLGSLADRTTRLTLPLYPQPRPYQRAPGPGASPWFVDAELSPLRASSSKGADLHAKR